LRKIISMVLILTAVFTLFSITASATAKEKQDTEFSDLDKNHWAYESVLHMVKAGIMEIDSKNRFNPGGAVTRGEFAVLIVKALELPLINPENGTFLDIPRGSKYYKYVETAKYYLTGYRTSQGDYFRPDESSVREDIAVSLVKALNFNPIKNYSAILVGYQDVEKISPNLRSFVASVVDNEIMVGTGAGDTKLFNPQLILTRAEVAKLLYNIITAEKVTYDLGDKVTYEKEDGEVSPTPAPTPTPATAPETSYTPVVSVEAISGGLKVEWTKTPGSGFSYYKVVMSKSNSSPSYPDDGYVTYISNNNVTSFIITPGQDYNGGDFAKVESGASYYITITAVYNHGKYTGNVLYKQVP